MLTAVPNAGGSMKSGACARVQAAAAREGEHTHARAMHRRSICAPARDDGGLV